jgi:hypothetical protein
MRREEGDPLVLFIIIFFPESLPREEGFALSI